MVRNGSLHHISITRCNAFGNIKKERVAHFFLGLVAFMREPYLQLKAGSCAAVLTLAALPLDPFNGEPLSVRAKCERDSGSEKGGEGKEIRCVM